MYRKLRNIFKNMLNLNKAECAITGNNNSADINNLSIKQRDNEVVLNWEGSTIILIKHTNCLTILTSKCKRVIVDGKEIGNK